MKCKIDYCEKYARTEKYELCAGHEYQMKKGKPFTPLRKWKRADIGVKGWLRCTKCEEIKKEEEFYLRPTGKRQSMCKVCFRTAQNGH